MKKICSAILVLMMLLTCVVGVTAEEAEETEESLTLEDIQEMFAITIETEGLSADELYALGQQYENGDGVVQWYAMAMAYYEAAEAAGSEDAAAAIEALNAYKQEVLDNSPDAQGEIFTFFRTGSTAASEGNYEQAYAVYYDDAFFFEDTEYRGIGSLGDLLLEGTGVEQDVEKAIAIYTFNATVLGKGNGYTSIGLVYEAETGTYPGIEQSFDTAIEYYTLSYTDENLTEADFKGPRYMADLYDSGYYHDDGTYAEPDYAKAEEGYLIAAAGNGRTYDATACIKLGAYYADGRDGVEQDEEKAVEYYVLGLSNSSVHSTIVGVPYAYYVLGTYYENGFGGLEADTDTAILYYELAIQAAEDNLELENTSDEQNAQEVYDDASEALERLGVSVEDALAAEVSNPNLESEE